MLVKRLETEMAKIMKFTVIDVENANPTSELLGSICQVGVAVVESGKIVANWSQLIDPQISDRDWWSQNIKIHGIRPSDVRGKPTFRDIYPEIKRSVARGKIVSHTLTDRDKIDRACKRYGLLMLGNPWRDSLTLARQAWPIGTRIQRKCVSSHSLPEIAPILGIHYKPHDAGEDARAEAELVLKAAAKIGTEEVNNWLRGG